MSFDSSLIHYGQNSGFQALNLAVHFGVRRIFLLGFDMKKAAGGKKHWFGDHPGSLNKDSPYAAFIAAFAEAAPQLQSAGIDVINCTPGSALTCFEHKPLKDVL